MGYRICLIAARLPVDTLIQGLDCAVVRAEDDMPDGEDWAAHVTATGWSVAWFEDLVIADVAEQVLLPQLSQQADVLVARVNETVMQSSTALWRAGRRGWRISHDGGAGDLFNLTRLGPAPADYAARQDAAYAAQDAETGGRNHVFEVPVRLFADRTGIRYDATVHPALVTGFQVIAARR